jgi:predicted dehydrogenase
MSNYSRRQFLTKATAGAALLSAVPAFSSSANPVAPYQGKKLRVALIGLGYYAEHRLAPGLAESKYCELAGIVTGTPEKAAKWKAKYNIPDKNIYNYQNFDQIADNKDIDVIYAVLPNSMHKEFVIRGAKAGKHCITEKPMALNAKEAEEMIAACKKANVKLFVGYRLHFEPFTMELMRMVKEKELGKIKVIETADGFKAGDPNQWRLKKALAGGGAMFDVGIYAIQGARYGSGEDPIAVTAQEYKTDPVKFKEVDETIFWQMEFPSGVVSNSVTTYASGTERLYVSGENGWVELRPAYGYGPLKGKTNKGDMNMPHTNHQALQFDGMGQAILENKVITATGEEGLKDMKIIDAIYRAIASGKKEKIVW